ncbi:DUF4115 domain-containing protein [Alteromonas sp. ASW11-36]|uniref:DUF4115 domain-containing protein n=1 Tax=Alteromonas arenosi TaxID=3055817 RepID=A0ABT7SVX1_9ALTE|nr:RodZ domain-containing protein [Alteromonas sp. ASW11-36]MDM7859697.1 DUF4115 domain-containing protein [Alteromonas sp. ASW11-36]
MTESQVEAEVTENATPTVGAQLKAGREAIGLSQQALADKLFLKLTIIQQLEDDNVDSATSSTFVKGYIRLYAKNVDLEPEPLVDLFNASIGVQKAPQKLQSFSRRTTHEARDNRWMMVTYFILAVVIALFVLWWYQQPQTTVSEVTATLPDVENIQTERTELPNLQSDDAYSANAVGVPLDEATDSVTEQPELSEPGDIDADVSSELGGEDTQALVDNDAPAIENLNQTETPATVDLVFNFSGDCWVNITDATGEAIAYGTKVAGRIMPITGLPPFEVTLGAPQNVAITFAGEPVDLSDIPEGRSARFTLPR